MDIPATLGAERLREIMAELSGTAHALKTLIHSMFDTQHVSIRQSPFGTQQDLGSG